MNQRNVIASFRDYDDANSAASELSRAGFGDVQIRILPPRTTYGRYRNQQIVVSAIVNLAHARAAENVLALNGGAIDLHEDANWGGARWNDRRGGFVPESRRVRAPRRNWLEDLPWGSIAGATVALLSGYAFWRGAHLLGQGQAEDYPPGQYRRNSRAFRSATNNPSYPDGDRYRRPLAAPGSVRASQLADEADLAWGDHDADDTAPLYDRPAGSGTFQTGAPARTLSSQGAGQHAAAAGGETLQVGIGSGSAITEGLRQDAGARSTAPARNMAGAAPTRRESERVR